MRIKLGRNDIPVEIFANYWLNRVLIPMPELGREVVCRLRETDPEVFIQVFVYKEYQHWFLPKEAKIIIDAGANVGYSVLFFQQRYPEATIIALEPDPVNFAVLQENCADLPHVILLQAALWNTCTTLQLQVADEKGQPLGSWGTRTIENPATETEPEGTTTIAIEAIDVPTLMQRFNFSDIDIFKIDIEGAEKEVFSDVNADWYTQTKLFSLETHERFATGSDAAVKAALPLDKWQLARKGENLFFRKIEPAVETQPNDTLQTVA